MRAHLGCSIHEANVTLYGRCAHALNTNRLVGGGQGTQGDEIAAAIALGFSADTPMPADIASLAAEGKLGEAILATMLLFQTGAAGEPVALTGALSAFRALGLEETARRGALEVRLLRRGL